MSENPYTVPVSHPVRQPEPAYDHSLPIIPGIETTQYPLQISFKILAFSSQLHVTDATGRSLLYVKQKFFKIKEKVEIFTDKTKTQKLATIQANKVIDWSARYFFHNNQGEAIGSVGRKGMRSLWKASYEVFNHGDDHPHFKINEENPAAKIFDSLLGEVPILGFATSFLFHPKYAAVSHQNDQILMRLTKKPALFQGKFELEKLGNLSTHDESNLILSYLMLVLLERSRG